MIIICGVFCIAALVYITLWLVSRYLKRNEDYWAKRGVPFAPGSSVWDTYRHQTTKSVHEIDQENHKKYGRIYGAFEFGRPLLYVSELDLIRDILLKDFHIFPTREVEMSGNIIQDHSLPSLRGNDWRRVRNVITPAFTSRRMRSMGTIINECTKSLLDTFDKHFEKKEPLDCRSVFAAFALDVVACVAFATKIDSHKDPQNIFVRSAKAVFLDFSLKNMLFKSILPAKIVSLFRTDRLAGLQFFKDIIQKVILERKQSGKRFKDILEILMEALHGNMSEEVQKEHSDLLHDDVDQFGTIIMDKEAYVTKDKKLSEDEFISQCISFFLAGYGTSSSTLSYISYCLALNQDWQEKLIKEVDEAFSKHTEMSHDVVQRMKVLDGVLSETLRMFPPTTRITRVCNQNYKLRNTDIAIEKGIQVFIPIYPIHYDPEYFEDPHTFNPERFMTSPPRYPQYSYLPFGVGPRTCVGMRFAMLLVKICIANILRRYRFRKASETQVPLKFRKTFGPLSVDKLPLVVEKRTDIPI